jgi:4-diphosphocytidyl-2-C-methyl-D-erythritol kinase
LGGGSSDGAAVLKGLNTLWGLGLSSGELMRTAAGLGSDCAFFIPCGTALCEGRGEVVTPLPVRGPLRFALLCPPLSVSTALVYGNLTGKDLTEPRCDDSILKEALATGQAVKIGQELFNRLEAPAFRLFKGLSAAKEQLSSACPAGVLMTGSGSALFGIGESASEVKEAARRVESLGLGAAIAVSSWSSEQTIAMVQGGRHEDNRCARPSSRKTR